MFRKELLKQALEKIIVEHENAINNCDDFAEDIATLVIDKLEQIIPATISLFKTSKKWYKAGITSNKRWGEVIPWNEITCRLDIPRKIMLYDNGNDSSNSFYNIKATALDILRETIKGMVVPILLQNYSFLGTKYELPFAEYCVQRIDDSSFASQMSNLVYAKRLYENITKKFENKNLECRFLIYNDLERTIRKLYDQEVDEKKTKDLNLLAESIPLETVNNSFLLEAIIDNDAVYRNSLESTSYSIYSLITQAFNDKRKEMGLPVYNLEFNDIESYSLMLGHLSKEIRYTDDMFGTYKINRFCRNSDEPGQSNGFFYEDGKFAKIEKKEDSLIESIKSKVNFNTIYDTEGKVVCSVAKSYDSYGWENPPLYEAQAYSFEIEDNTKEFINEGKMILADKVIGAYSKKQATSLDQIIDYL